MRALMVVLVAVAAVAVSPVKADAKCANYMIEHDIGSVERDGTVHVIGTGWGDNCYDTGEIPPGESVLGRPATEVEVLLIQGDVEHLVATGEADEKYGFTVDVPIPDDLKPGPIEVIARAGDSVGYVVTTGPLVISDAPPSGQSDDTAVHLGKSPPGTVALPIEPPSDDGTLMVAAGIALLAAGLAATGVYWARRRQA
ncbi:MAG: hypothetical protein ABI239_14635 [Aquihabitans sp.]